MRRSCAWRHDLLRSIRGGRHRRYLSWEKIRDFIVKQNDARGDAFGKEYYDKKAEDLVKKYTQHDKHFIQKGMCDEAFLRYLLSVDNLIVDPAKFDLFMDMDKPLSHYFISSSHNTYLTGSQLTGRASTEMYRQVLLTGCRCIELDVLDSEKKTDEPEIKHKNTPVRPVPFTQVIAAIRDCAFKVTPYPLILSLENRCNPRVQAKMAQYLVNTFGDSLITQPLATHPIGENCALPSPNDLKYKILIKNKKLPQNPKPKVDTAVEPAAVRKTDSIATTTSDQSGGTGVTSTSPSQPSYLNSPTEWTPRKQAVFNEIRNDAPPVEFDTQPASESLVDDDDTLTEEEEMGTNPAEMATSDQVLSATAQQSYVANSDAIIESKATKEMSDLVHYVVPRSFVTFAESEKRNRSYEISSFSEDKAQSLIREYAIEFVAYNQRQMSRIYPRGTRFDSSNYNPYLFWPVGCQMVALNYQTLDTPMQLNLGLFSFNGGCGYLEKPASLCQSTGSFDPKGRTNVENVVGYQIDIKLISGQFFCQDREPTYVDIEMYGMYADATKRHEYRLRAKRWNGFQAVYDDSDVEQGDFAIRFSKVILPEMASFRFVVSEEDGTFIGQSFIPVAHLRPGYRHVVLRNQINIPVQSASLFIYIRKDVHVDAENKDLIAKLVSPTSASAVEKEQQTRQIKFKPLSEQRSHSVGEINTMRSSQVGNIQPLHTQFNSTTPSKHHHRSSAAINTASTGAATQQKKRLHSTVIGDVNWYQHQSVVSSQLHDRERLCKELVLSDLEETKHFRRKREGMEAKIRRASSESDKKILYEEERLKKYSYRQRAGLGASPQRASQWSQIESGMPNNPYPDNRTFSLIHQRIATDDMKQAESRLLDLYSNKFHLQNELEYKLAKDYYNHLERYIRDYYAKQLSQINEILKHEQAKVQGGVHEQIKLVTKRTLMTETDREKIDSLKEKIRQMNVEAGALAIRKLQEMHEQLESTIQTNLQTALKQLHRAKDLETKNRFGKYSNQLNDIKHRLQREIYGYDSPDHSSSTPYRTTITTSASLSAIPHHQTAASSLASLPVNTSPSSTNDEYIGRPNPTTESTKL